MQQNESLEYLQARLRELNKKISETPISYFKNDHFNYLVEEAKIVAFKINAIEQSLKDAEISSEIKYSDSFSKGFEAGKKAQQRIQEVLLKDKPNIQQEQLDIDFKRYGLTANGGNKMFGIEKDILRIFELIMLIIIYAAAIKYLFF